MDIHKFLNKANESEIDPKRLSERTDMMGFKQNEQPVKKERLDPRESSG